MLDIAGNNNNKVIDLVFFSKQEKDVVKQMLTCTHTVLRHCRPACRIIEKKNFIAKTHKAPQTWCLLVSNEVQPQMLVIQSRLLLK